VPALRGLDSDSAAPGGRAGGAAAGRPCDCAGAGAADSVEVVQSEESLASAEHDFIGSRFSAALARVSLARAMGEAEKDVPAILKGSKE